MAKLKANKKPHLKISRSGYHPKLLFKFSWLPLIGTYLLSCDF